MKSFRSRRLAACLAAGFLTWTSPAALAALEWETTEITLTPALGQREAEAVFTFVNSGNQTVELTQVSASCGCTVPALTQRTFAPGERGEIRSLYTIGDRQGFNRSVISVHTDAPRTNVQTLTLNIDIPVAVQITPRVINWRVGEKAAPKEVEVLIHPDLDAALVGLLGADDAFTAEVRPTGQKGRYRLIVIPASTAERARASFALKLDPAPERPLQLFAVVY